MIYAAGLPVPADHTSNAARTNADIRGDWGALFNPDPSPNVSDDLLAQWRLLGNRSLVDEKDTVLGMAYGSLPQVDRPSNTEFTNFHPSRMNRRRLDPFLATLRSQHGHDLTTLGPAGRHLPPHPSAHQL